MVKYILNCLIFKTASSPANISQLYKRWKQDT